MKRLSVFLLMLLFLVAQAQASVTRYTVSTAANAYHECVDFVDELAGEAEAAFGSMLREGDQILGGTLCKTLYKNVPGTVQKQMALMAVQREGSTLVMSARWDNDLWQACIETDNFIIPGTEFSITSLAECREDILCEAYPSIVCGNEAYRLRMNENGSAYICDYVREEPDGSTVTIEPGFGGFSYWQEKQGEELERWYEHSVSASRLCAWTLETFPKNISAIQQYILANPVGLGADEAFLHGGNFREKPTGVSRSMGQYSAKAKIIGSQMGANAPWYHVRVGNLTGWVSNNYVTTGPYDALHYYGGSSTVSLVARAVGDIPLRKLPDGDTLQMIPDGTLMHILMENEGWVHVIIPRGEITWQTDWDGTYGFVKLEEIAKGVSIADVKWK